MFSNSTSQTRFYQCSHENIPAKDAVFAADGRRATYKNVLIKNMLQEVKHTIKDKNNTIKAKRNTATQFTN